MNCRAPLTESNIMKFLSILAFFFALAAAPLECLGAGQIYVAGIETDKTAYAPGETIKGSFSARNFEAFPVYGLSAVYELRAAAKSGDGSLMERANGTSVFSLKAGEEAGQDFILNVPSGMPYGSAVLRIVVAGEHKEPLAYRDVRLECAEGENGPERTAGRLELSGGRWIMPGGDLPLENLVHWRPGAGPKAVFKINNVSGNVANAVPVLRLYSEPSGILLAETRGEGAGLYPFDSIEREMAIPEPREAGPYSGEIRLYDGNSGRQLSNILAFRFFWRKDESASVRITGLAGDKRSYGRGEPAVVRVMLAGSIPAATGHSAILSVEISEKGESRGRAEKEIDLRADEETLEVPVETGTDRPVITAKIIRDGIVLDQYEMDYGSSLAEKSRIAEEKAAIKNAGAASAESRDSCRCGGRWLPFLILAATFAGFLFIAVKTHGCGGAKRMLRNIISRKTFLAMLAVWLVLCPNASRAAKQTAALPAGWLSGAEIMLSSPMPGDTFAAGESIRITGRILASGNEKPSGVRVNFYLAEDKDAGTKACGGAVCLDPGAGKLTKLGSASAAEFDETFDLPGDAGFTGPALIYLEYSAVHRYAYYDCCDRKKNESAETRSRIVFRQKINLVADSAECAGIEAPDEALAGHKFSATVSIANSGGKSWQGPPYALFAKDGAAGKFFEGEKIALAGTVNPGGTAKFTAEFTAPETAGNFPFNWRMGRAAGARTVWLGEICGKNILVKGVSDDAGCARIDAPDSVFAGERFSAAITVSNTGTKIWKNDATPHRLGTRNPANNLRWGKSRIDLPDNGWAGGGAVTFAADFKAPSVPGKYSFDWRVIEEGLNWVGADCGKNITVIAPTLFADFAAEPAAGFPPLETVFRSAVSGNAAGTVNYTFWPDCRKNCLDVAECRKKCGEWDYKKDGQAETELFFGHVYAAPGKFVGKLVIERGPLAAVKTVNIEALLPGQLPPKKR